MKHLGLFLVTALIFFAIDMIWLGWLAKGFYRQHIGELLSRRVNWLAASIFYTIYLLGILYFAVLPSLAAAHWGAALVQGALLGALCYATYDLTNMATLKGWSWTVVVVDILWGTVLTALTSLLSWWVAKNWLMMP
jgi:uncharacterized membrane protein